MALEKNASSSSSSSSVSTHDIKLDSKAHKISHASSNEVVADSIEQGTTTTTSTADPTTSSSATAVATTTTAVPAKSTEGKRHLDSFLSPQYVPSFLTFVCFVHICAFFLDSAAIVLESIVSSTTTSTSTTRTTTTSTTTSASTTTMSSTTTTEEPIVLQVEDDNVEGEMNERLSIPILANDVYPECEHVVDSL